MCFPKNDVGRKKMKKTNSQECTTQKSGVGMHQNQYFHVKPINKGTISARSCPNPRHPSCNNSARPCPNSWHPSRRNSARPCPNSWHPAWQEFCQTVFKFWASLVQEFCPTVSKFFGSPVQEFCQTVSKFLASLVARIRPDRVHILGILRASYPTTLQFHH